MSRIDMQPQKLKRFLREIVGLNHIIFSSRDISANGKNDFQLHLYSEKLMVPLFFFQMKRCERMICAMSGKLRADLKEVYRVIC